MTANLRRFAVLILTVIAVTSTAATDSDCERLLAPGQSKAHAHENLNDYIAGMEKSGLQKAAYAAMVRPGKVADLGSGSGVSAHDLAILFPESSVVGIDLDPGMVELASGRYRRANLEFKIGNAEEVNFAPDSLTGVFMSSAAHHLTSYGSGSFDVTHVRNAFRAVHTQLAPGGVFVFRDFLAPENGGRLIYLDLPQQDGKVRGMPTELSTAALFKKFARDFRSSQHPAGGVPYEVIDELPGSMTRFRLSLRDATEFLLRKDYRDHYDAEIKEEYTFMTQAEMEESLRQVGFRILHSAPIFNPWIIANRFRGHSRLTELDGTPVPFPATNYIIAGEKVSENAGVGFREAQSTVVTRPGFLRVHAMRNSKTREVFDVVERPQDTVDTIPYFVRDRRVYVMGKQGFPRPILTTIERPLSGSHSQGYVIEPISFLRRADKPEFADIEEQLKTRAGIAASQILARGPGRPHRFYTSPGIVSERVTSVAIPIRSRPLASVHRATNYSGFSESGVIRSIEATQVLRTGQAGSMLDARMEIGVYDLLLDRGDSVGPWIGEEITATSRERVAYKLHKAKMVLDPKARTRAFQPLEESAFGSYLEVRRSEFEEFDRRGQIIASAVREYVVPRHHSGFVTSFIPFFSLRGEIHVGLEERQLPGVQLNEGHSDLVTNPAWRLANDITNLEDAVEHSVSRLQSDFGVKGVRHFTLGGPYHPTPGVTAETVYPYAVEVDPANLLGSRLKWVELRDLIENRHLIKDANLLVAIFRLGHAMGLVK